MIAMTPDEVRTAAFGKPRIGKRGYDKDSVDAVRRRIEATLRGQPSITVDELRAITWPHPPIGKRGYREEDVDAFMQRVIGEWPRW